MDYKELLEKYNSLLAENRNLKEENKSLKARLRASEGDIGSDNITYIESTQETLVRDSKDEIPASSLSNMLSLKEKVELFMSLFKGRDDVYAVRWVSKKTGHSGYSPVCLNEWIPGVCEKKKVKCVNCPNKAYAVLDETAVDSHLRGNAVVGLYPMCVDETCFSLAIDFDDEDWKKDISVIRDVCCEFDIPVSVERSRSGRGAHMWFFFESQISALLARKFGSALLTHAMNKRHEITFKSYDRFFPNQDTMPKGGLGNLIALPLQKSARKDGNSVFIDEKFEPYNDQWTFLSSIQKLSESDIEMLISKLSDGNELGILIKDEEETHKPWEPVKSKLSKDDFPQSIEVVRANMLFIPMPGMSQRALNHIKRFAAFKNPEFYKMQAMRMPAFNIPRIICCADEEGQYLCLPRGCENDLKALFEEQKIGANFIDRVNRGKSINVEFNGSLRDEQPLALNQLLKYDNGVLSGTTAFGKTIVAIKLIAEKKVNTLILVDKVSLVSQWRERLSKFLTINEVLPDVSQEKKRGRKKKRSSIGQIGAGKETPSGIIDIAVMQSLYRMGEVKDLVKNYGMVIVDECHHVSAFSFEKILKNVNAKYVYGLTATPARKDGHHPIIFMQCGPVRYRDDAKKQAEKRPFEHYIIPKFTPLRVPLDKDEKDVSIQELYSAIVSNEARNDLIIDDVVKNNECGRNCIVLTERTAHVELIAKKLSEKIPDVIALTGGMGIKETRESLKLIAEMPIDKQLTIVATGKYIGEGFDEPRLDTLFLAMPISWKGTLQQYAGRLHRLFEGKSEVHIYDYVDIHVRMLEKMYNRRLSGYASIGYKAKCESIDSNSIDFIFDKQNFLPVFSSDIISSVREILIVSPYVTKRRTSHMLKYLSPALSQKVKVIVVTRPVEDFEGKDNASLKNTLDLLESSGVSLVFKSNIHQKFAIMDQKIVWYGSINLLSYGSAEESIMRLESPNIANELIRVIED